MSKRTDNTMRTLPRGTPERRILNATLATIARNTISGTRTREIAQLAGMSQGNLHYYFPSKADLFLALLNDMLEAFVDERAAEVSSSNLDPLRKLEAFFEQEKRILRERRALKDVFFDFWVQGTRDPLVEDEMRRMYEAWYADISKVIGEGIDRGFLDGEQVTMVPELMVSFMEGAALQYLIAPGEFDLDAYFAVALRMVLMLLAKPNVPPTESG
jgi:TetR/AcrR family transcriptional regulator